MHYHNRLLISTSLYALSLALAPRALAACDASGEITAQGLCTTPQVLESAAGTVVSGATLSTGTSIAYTVNFDNATFQNSGIITSSVADLDLGSVTDNATNDVLINAGTIENSLTTAQGAAVFLTRTEAGVTNATGGLLEATGNLQSGAFISDVTSSDQGTALTGSFVNNGTIISDSTGVEFINGSIGGDFINNGLIDHTGTDFGLHDFYDFYGVAGNVINSSTGTLLSGAATLVNAQVEGIYVGNVGGSLINAGLIDVSGNGISAQSGISGKATISGDFINSGTILAGVSGTLTSNGVELDNVNGKVVNSGLIASQDSGIIVEGSIAGDLDNSGTIIGLTPYNNGFGGQTGIQVNGTVGGNIVNSGTIVAAITGIYLDEFTGELAAGTSLGNSVVNSGLIEARDAILSNGTFAGSFENLLGGTIAGSINGLQVAAVLGSFLNAGTITGSSGAVDLDYGGAGISSGILGGSFTNTGLISAGTGSDLADGAVIANTIAGAFNNSGSIVGGDDFAGIYAPFFGGSITNSGYVQGDDDAFYLIDGAFGAKSGTGTIGGNFLNTGTGTIVGQAFNDVYFDVLNGSFINDGLIIGGAEEGVTGQTINGDFINAGTISADNAIQIGGTVIVGDAIAETGTVTGNIVNSGLIASSGIDDIDDPETTGFYLPGVGGSFTNSGTISGVSSPALDLAGTIAGGFTNTGTGVITGTERVLRLESGTGNFTLNNAGTISSTSGIPIYAAGCAAPAVCSLNLTNSGNITGGGVGLAAVAVDVLSETAPSTITQAAGTITGAIDLPGTGLADVIDIDGGQINGEIADGDPGLPGGTLSGTVNFNLASGSAFTIQSGDGPDFEGVYASSVNINSGTVVMNGRIDTQNGVFNDGVLQTGILGDINPGDAQITGNYTQGAGGTLLEEISDNGNNGNYLAVIGNASLDGRLELYFDPGTYSSLNALVLETSNGGTVSGTFASLALAPDSASPGDIGTTYTAISAHVTLSPPPPPPIVSPPPPPPPVVSPPPPPPPPPVVSPPPPPPPPIISPPPPPPTPPPPVVSPPPPPVVSPPPPPPPVVSPPPPPPPPVVSPPPPPPPVVSPPPPPPPPPPVVSPPPPVVVAPQHATIFPELATVAIIDAERSIDTLLNHAISAPSGTGSTQLAFNDVSNPLGSSHGGGEQLAELGNVIPEIYAAYGAWIEASGNFADVHSGRDADDRSTPGYHAQTGGFLAGLAQNITPEASLGVAVGYEHFNLSEDETHASGTDDTGRIALYGAYDFGQVTLSAAGGLGYDAFSTTRPLSIGTAREKHSGLEANLGLQLSQNLDLGPLLLVPSAGVEYANLQEDGFSETGASGADLNGHAHGTNSLQPFAGVAAGLSFGLGTWSITPSTHVTYRYETSDRQRSLVVAAQDGALFNIDGISTARNQLGIGAGISAAAGPNLQVFGAYDALVGFGFGLDQSVSAGVKYSF